jgi:putative CocE/NonD family hydrolase
VLPATPPTFRRASPHAAVACCAALASLLAPPAAEPADGTAFGPYAVQLTKSVRIPMRDGVTLSTDLYVPQGAGDKLPVVLVRTPYNKAPWRMRAAEPASLPMPVPSYFFASHGFVVAVQDVRGKFESDGEYIYAGHDAKDGFDTTEWLASQPWSNGRVGTYGCSYLGEVQYQQATQRSPHLTAMIPQGAGPVQYRAGGGIDGGVVEVAALVGWLRERGSKLYYRPPVGTTQDVVAQYGDFFHPDPVLPNLDYRAIWESLPLVDMLKKAGAPPNDWVDIVSKDFSDPWWNNTDFIRDSDHFDAPALHVNSWNDFGVGETLHLFNLLREHATSTRSRDAQFAIISPMTHCRSEAVTEHTAVGQRDLGDARLDYYAIYLRWFNYWLKGLDTGVTQMPHLQIYVMGANRWRAENEWPLKRTRFTKYYLHSTGHANSLYGDGSMTPTAPRGEPADHYAYDPRTPVATVGGALCLACSRSADIVDGAQDQSQNEIRDDVLVYTTPPLPGGLEVTGPLELVLFVSSSARDTDFTGKLVDVYPDGTAFNIQEGILRARYREGFEHKVLMNPGGVYELHINLHATSNYFAPGHRIRLEVSSSNFPRFDRNLNTGGNNYDETVGVIALNSIQHSSMYPSHLVLPVIPASASSAAASANQPASAQVHFTFRQLAGVGRSQ